MQFPTLLNGSIPVPLPSADASSPLLLSSSSHKSWSHPDQPAWTGPVWARPDRNRTRRTKPSGLELWHRSWSFPHNTLINDEPGSLPLIPEERRGMFYLTMFRLQPHSLIKKKTKKIIPSGFKHPDCRAQFYNIYLFFAAKLKLELKGTKLS